MSSWAVASALSVYSPFSPTGILFFLSLPISFEDANTGFAFFSFYILYPVCCQWQRNKARTRDAVFRWQSEDDLSALHKSSLRVTFQSLGLTLSAEVLETAYLNDNTCPLGLN